MVVQLVTLHAARYVAQAAFGTGGGIHIAPTQANFFVMSLLTGFWQAPTKTFCLPSIIFMADRK